MRKLKHYLDYFKKTKLHDDFKEFKEVLGEIDGVLRFPIDLEQAVATISEVEITPENFDKTTAQFFAIEHLKGFPNDPSMYNYAKLLKDFVPFIEEEKGKPDDGDQIRRSILFMEFRKAHRLLVFKSKYHQIANIYRSPAEQYQTLRKRTRLFNILMEHNGHSEVDQENLSPSQYIDDAKALQKGLQNNQELCRCKSTAIDWVAAIDPKTEIRNWPWSELKSTQVELSQCNFIQDLVKCTEVYVGEVSNNTSGVPEPY